MTAQEIGAGAIQFRHAPTAATPRAEEKGPLAAESARHPKDGCCLFDIAPFFSVASDTIRQDEAFAFASKPNPRHALAVMRPLPAAPIARTQAAALVEAVDVERSRAFDRIPGAGQPPSCRAEPTHHSAPDLPKSFGKLDPHHNAGLVHPNPFSLIRLFDGPMQCRNGLRLVVWPATRLCPHRSAHAGGSPFNMGRVIVTFESGVSARRRRGEPVRVRAFVLA